MSPGIFQHPEHIRRCSRLFRRLCRFRVVAPRCQARPLTESTVLIESGYNEFYGRVNRLSVLTGRAGRQTPRLPAAEAAARSCYGPELAENGPNMFGPSLRIVYGNGAASGVGLDVDWASPRAAGERLQSAVTAN